LRAITPVREPIPPISTASEPRTGHTLFSDESGAVTVDWVVLTAALVGLSLAVMGVISSGLKDAPGDITKTMERDDIVQPAFTGNAAAARDTACGATTYRRDDPSRNALANLSTEPVNGLDPVDYGTDFLGDDGYSLDADGVVGTSGGTTRTAADDDTQARYAAAVTASTAQNALISAEQALRATPAPTPAPEE
jgi:hypothetical protein